jgi:hypothetical protein
LHGYLQTLRKTGRAEPLSIALARLDEPSVQLLKTYLLARSKVGVGQVAAER